MDTGLANRGKGFGVNKLLALLMIVALSGCGFLNEPRACEAYGKTFLPDEEAAILVTWPIHLVMLCGCAAIDQGARTVESLIPAGRDAYDYLVLPVNDDNVMFARTVAVPKAVTTPVIFVGSYAVRWLIPLDEDSQPFEVESLP